MASTTSETRELGNGSESRGSYLERLERGYLVHAALMQIEVGILQVHCQGSSPFETDPAKMWTFLFAKFIHFGAALSYVRTRLTGSRCSKICDLVGYVSGSLTSAAYLSILVPPSLVPLVFVVWMLQLPLYVDGARDRFFIVAQKLYLYFSKSVVSKVHNILNRIIGGNN